MVSLLALLEVATMSEFEKVLIQSASEDSTSESLEEKPKLRDLNHDPHENNAPTNFKTKIYHVGSGNIIGKNIIQEFFNCTGVIPIIKGSIFLTKQISMRMLLLILWLNWKENFCISIPLYKRYSLNSPTFIILRLKRLPLLSLCMNLTV